MRIKKTSQTTTTQAQIVDGYSESKIDGYSANYVNNNIKSKYTQLWTGHASSGTEVLNDSIENYDFILVVVRGGGYTRGTSLIPVSLIEYGSGDSTPWSVVAFQNASVFGSLKLNFTNSTTISITEYHNNWTSGFLEEVIGIKL